MNKTIAIAGVIIGVSMVAFAGLFTWLTTTTGGINYMFEWQGFKVENDPYMHQQSDPIAQNVTLSQFITLLKENVHNGCCEQSQAYWDSINPKITMSWYAPNGNHHTPKYYWHTTINGTVYQWVIWRGN